MTFQPPLNRDFSPVNIDLAAGHARSTRPRRSRRPGRGHRQQGPQRRTRVRAGRVGNGAHPHRAQEGPRADQHRVRADPGPDASAIPDARVSFQSQSGGGPDGGGRDIMLYLGGDDPDQADRRRAADRQGNGRASPAFARRASAATSSQPEITIKPRFDLAADLGVTTAALSQTIRIATIGDIEQNSAKFSLVRPPGADHRLAVGICARATSSTLENLPVPTSNGGSVPLKSVAEIGFGSGPTTIQRTEPDPPHRDRRRPGARRRSSGDVWPKINELPTVKNLPQGVQKLNLGDQKWQARADLLLRARAGRRRPARVRGAGAALPPLPLAVRQHGLAAAGAAGRRDRAPHRRPAGVAAGADRHPDAVRDRRQELDPAGRFRGRDDRTTAWPRTRRSTKPGTSAPSRSS